MTCAENTKFIEVTLSVLLLKCMATEKRHINKAFNGTMKAALFRYKNSQERVSMFLVTNHRGNHCLFTLFLTLITIVLLSVTQRRLQTV